MNSKLPKLALSTAFELSSYGENSCNYADSVCAYIYTPKTSLEQISNYTVEVKNYQLAVNDITLVTVYYILPKNITADTKVFFAMGGIGTRDDTFANALRYLSEKENLAVIAPIYLDRTDWPYSDIVFEDFVERFGLKAQKYILYGFSQGGYFTARQVQFKESKYIDYAIVHSAGWSSNNISLRENRRVYIITGRKEETMQYLGHAFNMFNTGKEYCEKNGWDFSWRLFVMDGIGHVCDNAILPYILDIINGLTEEK